MKTLYHIFVFTVVFTLPQVESFSQCGDENLSNELGYAASKASEWLKNFLVREPPQNDFHIDATAYHSLRLAGYQPVGNLSQNIRPSEYEPGRLALYVNGFTATCQTPFRRFIRHLKKCIEIRGTKCGSMHRFQYFQASLTLCNNREPFKLSRLLINTKIEMHKKPYIDTAALASITLSCVSKRQCDHNVANERMCRKVFKRNKKIINWLLRKQQSSDGSFGGNGISTALAAQAFLAYNVSSQKWQCSKVMKYLLSKQKSDGSLGGLVSTIQILPVLKGVTLMDQQRIEQSCRKNQTNEENMNTTISNPTDDLSNVVKDHGISDSENEKEYIKVTLRIEAKGSPPCSFHVKVKNESTVYEVFRAAEKTYSNESVPVKTKCDKSFQFGFSSTRYGRYIDSILGFKENVARKEHYWIMYTEKNTKAAIGIDEYRPRNGTTIIFRLEKVDSQIMD